MTVVAYCDAYDVAVALNIAGAQDDGWLTTLADSASRWVDAHCAIPFGGFAVTATACAASTRAPLMMGNCASTCRWSA